jgi:hypothetical protein
MPEERIVTRLVRALPEGQRESLTIAGYLGVPVAQVNEVLSALYTQCTGCLELVQPYPDEPRLIVTVRDWRPLQWGVANDGTLPRRSRRTFR